MHCDRLWKDPRRSETLGETLLSQAVTPDSLRFSQRTASESVLWTARIWFINFTFHLAGTNLLAKISMQKLKKKKSNIFTSLFFPNTFEISKIINLWQMKQLIYMWMSSLVTKSEYYINSLVYMSEFSKANFSLPILLRHRSEGESCLWLLLVSRVLKMTFWINIAFLPF